MPMRILFVSHTFPPKDRPETNLGGMQRVAMDLYHAFEQSEEVEVIPLILRSSWKWINLNTARFLLQLWWTLPRIAKREKVDAVLFSSMVTATLVTKFGAKLRALGIKSFAIVHGLDITMPVGFYQNLLKKVFAEIDAIFPVSSATAEACMARGLPQTKCHVVPNGIRLDRFKEVFSRVEARHTLLEVFGRSEIADTDLLLCSVGRQVERKGFHWFIENVMPSLPANVHYWLAGEGPMMPRIQEAIEKSGTTGRVKLLGRVSETQLELLYQGADLFIMPNIPVAGDMEGFGVVLLEGGICGLPAIGARLEGIRDVIHEGENGHLVPSQKVEAFVQTISSYFDRMALNAASERTRAYIPKTFSWDGVAKHYLYAIQGFLSGTPPN